MKYLLLLGIFCSACIAIKPSERIEFDAQDLYPEGVAYDAATSTYFVSSQRTGTIGKVDLQGNYTVLHADSTLKSSYGMKLHPDGKRLFVCTGDANYSKFTSPDTRKKTARLISIDIAGCRRLSDVDLSGLLPGKHFANDLAFDLEGNIYVTDSYANAIYKIDAGGKASVFSKDTIYNTQGYGLNGIVYHPGGFLLVDNSNTGCVYKVDLKDPGKPKVVAIDQYFLGADGLVLKDAQHLAVVTNGGNDKIFGLETTDNWASARLSATTLIADRFTYPATATTRGDQIWVMNAKTNELLDSNAIPARKFAIQLAVLKPVPKK